MSGATLMVAGGAWACVPGHEHDGGGGANTGGTGTEAAAIPGAPVAPAPPGPEAAAAANATALTPALPSVPAASSSPVTGAGMWNPAPAASTSSSSSGGRSQTVFGVGLFAAGGILVVGGMAQMARTRRPQRRLAPISP